MPNGVTETSTYDSAGLLSSITDTKGATVITSRSYIYDADANPTTIVTQSETDTYDNQDRLTSACYATSCSKGSIAYTYDAANELTGSTTGSSTTTFTYDADGRRTKSVGPSGTTSDSWNAANELTGVTTPTTSFTDAYDGDGNRVGETAGGTTTTFVFDTNAATAQLAEELNGTTELRRYVWGGTNLLSMRENNGDYYVAHDAQGSVIGLTSSTGATEVTTTYDPFGNVFSTTRTDPNAPAIAPGFDAGYQDPSGLDVFGVRQLDPTTGAFLSTDPLDQNPQAPAASSYLFVGDQPSVLVDLNGQSAQSIVNQVNNDVSPWADGPDVVPQIGSAGVGSEGVSTASSLYTVYQLNQSADDDVPPSGGELISG